MSKSNLLFMYCIFILLCVSVESYNVDVKHVVVLEKPIVELENSYFGYSVVLFNDKKNPSKWLKIGAPMGTYKHQASVERICHSGLVYHCPYMEKCHVDDRFNYSVDMDKSWIGGIMDISSEYKTLVVSMSKYQKLDKDNPMVTGGIFVENILKEKQETDSIHFKDHLYVKDSFEKDLPFNARALAGLSMHFPQGKNELLVGAPGVNNFLGTVFRIRNIEKTKKDWIYEELIPRGSYYDHTGYALTSGHFYFKHELRYAVGLPKAFQKENPTYSGSVVLFKIGSPIKIKFIKERKYTTNIVGWTVKETLHGNQFGEHFGASLAAVDLNGDGFDELIVGAPFRCNDELGYNHGSVYIFYGGKERTLAHKMHTLDGNMPGGQFGMALMVLGDLDRDGFKELAISAPNEHERSGAVYIYSYDAVLRSLKLSQKIAGKEVLPGLKGFGVSLSRAIDIDDNGFIDFAVGSPISGHAVILRTKPTVSVFTNIIVPKSLSKSNTTFMFKCCYSFKGYLQSNISLIRNLTVDREFYRFYFKNKKDNFEQNIINVVEGREYCEDIHLVKMESQNYDDPITIELTYELLDKPGMYEKSVLIINDHFNNGTKDNFCKHCPVLGKKSITRKSRLVIWDHNCEHNGRMEPCKASLEVKARFASLEKENTFVVGTDELLNLDIVVVNRGDPAYSPSLSIQVPSGASYTFGSADCQSTDIKIITCDGNYVLFHNASYRLKFSINAHTPLNNLTFFMNVSTLTESIKEITGVNLTLNIERDADFYVTGYSRESSYVYDKAKPTLIQNIFKLEKFGPSPTPTVRLDVIFPYKLQSIQDGEYKQFVKMIPNQYSSTSSAFVICNQQVSTFKGSIIQSSFKNFGSKTLNINCALERVACAVVNCSIGPFENLLQTHAEVVLDFEVNFGILTEAYGNWLPQTDQITWSTQAVISVKDFRQSGNRTDIFDLSNAILTYKEGEISLWILIGSAIVGLIILICVTVALAKGGFFERKEHRMLLELKEEALKEEKLIEEMIEKELQTAEPFQGDPAFRYIEPGELRDYWNHPDDQDKLSSLLKEQYVK